MGVRLIDGDDETRRDETTNDERRDETTRLEKFTVS
jgi:hypothetical protein